MSDNIAKTLIATDADDVKLDKTIKRILSNKAILTRIIAEVVDECKGMSFDENKDANEKLNELKNNYNIPVNTELETEVEKMCTYTEKIKTESEEKGIAKGKAKAENDLIKAVQMLRADYSDEEILAEGISDHTLNLAKTIK